MNKRTITSKRLLASLITTILVLSSTFVFTVNTVKADSGVTDIYTAYQNNDVSVGDTFNANLTCTTTQTIDAWQFTSLFFTPSLINCSKVTIGLFFTNPTSQSHIGSIHNATGVIGGSIPDWTGEFCQTPDTPPLNKTLVNLKMKAMGCGTGNLSFTYAGDYVFFHGGEEVVYTAHDKKVTIHPAKASSFAANAYQTTQINLTWIKGPGALKTVILGKKNSYPKNVYDATSRLVANTTFQRVNDTSGLNPGELWCYRAWSWNEAKHLWSISNVSAQATTGSTGTTTISIGRQSKDIDIGNTTKISIWCDTTQPITIWEIGWVNFTQGVVNCSNRVRGTFFVENQTDGSQYYWHLGTIYNSTGSIGSGISPDCSYETVESGGAKNNINRSFMNMTYVGKSCGIASTTLAILPGETSIIGINGNVNLPYTFHRGNVTVHPARPTTLSATAINSTKINISWSYSPSYKTSGAKNLRINGKIGSYPTSIIDGSWTATNISLAANSGTVSHTDLNPSTHWYYRAWSWNETKHLWSVNSQVTDAITSVAPHAPTIYVVMPKNQTTNVNRQPRCRILVNDSNSDALTVKFYSSTNGISYTLRQTNTTSGLVSVNQVVWNYTQATSYSTTYYWRVTADDGTTVTSKSYWFTTKAQGAHIPITYVIVPKNQSINVNRQPVCKIRANDSNSDALTIDFYRSTNGIDWFWDQTNTTGSVLSTLVTWNYSEANSYSTRYWWKVVSTDGTSTNTTSYYFDTKALGIHVPKTYVITPKNQSININRQPTCKIWANDSNSDVLTIDFYFSSDGGANWFWKQTNVTNPVPSTIVSWNYSDANSYSTRYWWKVVSTDGTSINTTFYYFDTRSASSHIPTIHLISPKNQSSNSNKQPVCTVRVNDSNSDVLTVNFYSSSDGIGYTRRQKNTTSPVLTSVVTWNYTQASSYNTRYYWKVTTYDGTTNASKWFYFSTKLGPHAPTFDFIDPANQSIGVHRQPICSLWVNDTASDVLAVNFYSSTDGIGFTHRQKNTTGAVPGTLVKWNYSQAASNGTLYYWKVTAYDGVWNVSSIYHFTTRFQWNNVTVNLTFNTTAGGGLNFISSLNNTNASNVANLVGPACAQVLQWDASNQSWSEYIPGTSPPDMNFNIYAGGSIGIEVTANVSIILSGFGTANVRTLIYNSAAGGGLNWLGRTDDSNPNGEGPNIHASDIAAHISIPSSVKQILYWNDTIQEYEQFICGVDMPGDANDFQIRPGMAVGIEVTATVTLDEYGW
jgi:hypothetical protein